MEKQELAKKLHDGLSQTLTAVSMNLTILSKSVDCFAPMQREMFFETKNLLDQAVEESRSISRDLLKHVDQ